MASVTSADTALPGTLVRKLYRGDTRVLHHLIREQTGTDESGQPVFGAPKDLSGYTFRAQLRADFDDTAVLAVLTVEFVTDGTDGRLYATLPAAVSATLPRGDVYYDLEATRTSDGFVRTYLAGRWKVLGDVSRAAAG